MIQKLSIIIPCYNCSLTLEEAVVSVYQQKLDIPFEVILVDDKSTDNTVEIMEKMAQKYPEVKCLYHKKNSGGGATRNTGINNSTGDIIFCLDSDDILPDSSLSRMYWYLLEKKCDGVTIHRSIKFIGNNPKNIGYTDISPFINERITIDSLLAKDKKFRPAYVTFMHTRNAFQKAGGYPTEHGYDTQGFGWRFLSAGLNLYTCPGAEYLHRINFNESYFLREYNNGKMNYNWRNILLEHHYLFTEDALNFICSFDCSDFTRNIMDELILEENILRPSYQKELGQSHPKLSRSFPTPIYINRNSIKGYILRIKHKIRLLFLKN